MEKLAKHIFVTGGVVSSLGKGLTASSIGRLFRARNYRVAMQKLDPYINIDPGTMNPFQHGEVFVTDDGAETDLDIGHYERFLDVHFTKEANVTTGGIYKNVIKKERKGKYLGDTVQVIPHITNQIKEKMRAQSMHNVDVIITEIGGTIGDIEGLPFLEAARQLKIELGPENVFFAHVSLVPFIKTSSELKTKPTQHSVVSLRSLGVQPDALILRSPSTLPNDVINKVALMCGVDKEAVVTCPDVKSIYNVPSVLHDTHIDSYILEKLNIKNRATKQKEWDKLTKKVNNGLNNSITVGLIGKYIDLPDAYLSVVEAINAGGFENNTKVNIKWIEADNCITPIGASSELKNVDAIVVPGGFGIRGIDGKIGALKYARENKIPSLGLCLGMQCMVIEFAQNKLGLKGAYSTEFMPNSKYPVIATLKEQEEILEHSDMGGTMRLGSYQANLKKGTLTYSLYNSKNVFERHRHRYEVNNSYRGELEQNGLIISGTSPDNKLVEFVELNTNNHPFYIGTQAHPEFKSRPTKPHPLFIGLIKAGIKTK